MPENRRSSQPQPAAGGDEPIPVGVLGRFVRAVARFSTHRPKLTILLWIVLIVGCIAAGAATGTTSLKGSEGGVGESARADRLIEQAKLRGQATETILVRTKTATATDAAVRTLAARVDGLKPVAGVQSPASGGPDADALRADGGRSALLVVSLRGDPDDAGDNVGPVTKAVDRFSAAHPAVEVSQAGSGSIDNAIGDMVAQDLQRAELISIPITLLILIVAFGALVAASVPLLLGVTAVAGAMGALGVVSQVAPSGDSTGSLVVLIGLAVGVDYSLFYIRREREERRRGRGPEAALDAAAASVGRAILVSGVTVIVALAGLLLTGVPAFTSMALGTIVVVAIALLGSLTVLPAVLALLGDKIDRGRVPFLGRRRRRAEADGRGGTRRRPARRGVWGTIATVVTRRPAVALTSAVCLLGALAVPALGMHLADPGVSSLPAGIPEVQATKAVERAFPGAPDSAQLVIEGRDLHGAEARAGLEALGRRGATVTEGRGPVDVRVARDGRTAVVDVPMPDHGLDAAKRTVERLRNDVAPTATRIAPGTEPALVAGEAAGSLDFTKNLTAKLPLVLAFVLGLAFLLLVAVFRSLRLAATVIALNLLSIGATYGILVAVFQHSWAEDFLNFTSSGSVTSWIPLLAFVILFGLSMDYSILVLERIREGRINGLSPREAAAQGVAATGGSVTSAAVVMVAVFAVFATLRLLEMKQLGVGLASAILLDATIVRAVALPAAVTLLGEKAFRLPASRTRRSRARDGRAEEDHLGLVTPMTAASDAHVR